MNKLVTTILLLTTLTGYSQIIPEKKYKIGFTFSPDIYLKSSFISTGQYTGYHLNTSPFNFTTGVIGQLTLKPKLEIGTGITFSKKDYSGIFVCITCNSLPSDGELIKQRFIEVPLVIRYNIINKTA